MEFEIGINTYITLEEANSIIEDEFDTDSKEYTLWNELDDKGKKRLILKATRISEKLVYLGYRYDTCQTMAWPRNINFKKYEIPYEVKLGIIKQGLKDAIDKSTKEYKLKEHGIKRYAVNGASVEFVDNVKDGKISNGIYEDILYECFVRWIH